MTLLIIVTALLSIVFAVGIHRDARTHGWRAVPTRGDLLLALFLAFLLTLWAVLDASAVHR